MKNNLVLLSLLMIYFCGCGKEYYLSKARGYDEAGDYANAKINFEAAAYKGGSEAYYMLGLYYYEGRGVSKDYKRALDWFQKAYENGDSGYEIVLKIALIYNSGGYGVAKDDDLALKYFQAADKRIGLIIEWNPESSMCMFHAGNAYLMMGKPYRTIILFKKAIKFSPKEEMTNNQKYIKGLREYLVLVQKSYFESAKTSAEQNNPRAQYNLGFAYYEGIGVEKNLEEAVRYFDKAAEHDDALVLYKLAILYYDNKIMTQDFEKVKLYLNRIFELTDDLELKRKAQSLLNELIGHRPIENDNVVSQRKTGIFYPESEPFDCRDMLISNAKDSETK